jgi:PIN domain nuclease of toxin-antitoxin system
LRFLLDTHVLLWWARDEPLSPEARAAIASGENDVLVSAASIWEAEIKSASGKLELGRDLSKEAGAKGFRELRITFEHAVAAARLPPHHPDPFDRMLAAQVQLENLTLITRDPAFAPYGIPLLAA